MESSIPEKENDIRHSEANEKDHEFESVHIKNRAKIECGLCSKLILGFGKNAYQCRTCSCPVHMNCYAEAGADACKKQLPCTQENKIKWRTSRSSVSLVENTELEEKISTKTELPKVKQHNFALTTFTRPTYCSFCNEFIWGLRNQGLKCSNCLATVHKKCLVTIPGDCISKEESIRIFSEVELLRDKLKQLDGTTISREEGKGQLQPSQLAQRGNENDDDDKDMCVICWERKVNTLLLECGHRALCLECSAIQDCPICRQPIARVVKIYDVH